MLVPQVGNFPNYLAPESGEEPFDEWWPRVKVHISNVPEDVARYWLYEHRSGSPFSYVPLKEYCFKLVQWPADGLSQIRSTMFGIREDNIECQEHGRALIENTNEYPYKTAHYTLENGDFPAAIVVLDNHDGFLSRFEKLPLAYIVVEGHRRFCIALYLHSIGCLNPNVRVWLMERAS